MCDILWYMNDLKQVKGKHTDVLAPEFPDMDVAQFKASVTCTGTPDRDQVPSLSSSYSFTYPPYSTHLPPLDCTGCTAKEETGFYRRSGDTFLRNYCALPR
jgi:hypothetical protein